MATGSTITSVEFVAKWESISQLERAVSQSHFIDLCHLVGQPAPTDYDPEGTEYAFEIGVAVTGPASKGSKGHHGWADVWWKNKFAWEYKTKDKHKNLDEAYRQLCQYREALGNPPLLIVSDIDRIEIHTNFTGTAKSVHSIQLQELLGNEKLDQLRRVFTDPDSFKPSTSSQKITEEVATKFGQLAGGLHDRGHDPLKAAHFLMKCLFCLFAEDVQLLPPDLFARLLASCRARPAELRKRMEALFSCMKTGGAFGSDTIPCFNGELFDSGPALELSSDEIGVLILAAEQDWASVEPAIFGTLFERSLDPKKRAQIGAHYTGRVDIEEMLEPVLMSPLRREWQEVQAKVEEQIRRRDKSRTKDTKRKANKAVGRILGAFLARLSSIQVLDPACGSGNFLYVAIQQLLDLEKEVITRAAKPDIGTGLFPQVRPEQLHGIEISPYASELAQVAIWIGFLQWMHFNGFAPPRDPILQQLQTIENRDAILDRSTPDQPSVAAWPSADFIVGNPPFAGRKRKRSLLDAQFGRGYFDALEVAYRGSLKKGADLCCYWFELARRQLEQRPSTRAGLLATQGIRGGTNREVLDRIKSTGDIFFAISDRDWTLEDTHVHVSMIGFDGGCEQDRTLNGQPVDFINADLTTGTDATQARKLPANKGQAFQGVIPMGLFEIGHSTAFELLADRGNPNGRPNAEVIRPWANGGDMMNKRMVAFIIDFGEMSREEAAGFAGPFRHVQEHVLPARKTGNTPEAVDTFWRHWRPRPAMRAAIKASEAGRFIITARHSKHRIFLVVDDSFLPSDASVVIPRGDDYCAGVLHSSVHYIWSLRKGTQVREEASGKRYSHTLTFETFPFPWPLGSEPTDSPLHRAIEESFKELRGLRDRWMCPTDIMDELRDTVVRDLDSSALPETMREALIAPKTLVAASEDARIGRRTWTGLYSEYPAWLQLAHQKLDRAVLAAYESVDPEGGWSQDWSDVWFEGGAGVPLPADSPLADRRAQIDQRVLSNCLKLNMG